MNMRQQKLLSFFGALLLVNLGMAGLLVQAVSADDSVSALNRVVTFTDEQVSDLINGQSVQIMVDGRNRPVRLDTYKRVAPGEMSCVVPKDDDDYVVDYCTMPKDAWLGVGLAVMADLVLLVVWLVLGRPRPWELWVPSSSKTR